MLENTKVTESLEQRKQRLQHHRDLLLQQKNADRKRELEQFKSKSTTKSELYQELRDIQAKEELA